MDSSGAPDHDRFAIRRDVFGWTVFDVITGHVAIHDNVTLTGLTAEAR